MEETDKREEEKINYSTGDKPIENEELLKIYAKETYDLLDFNDTYHGYTFDDIMELYKKMPERTVLRLQKLPDEEKMKKFHELLNNKAFEPMPELDWDKFVSGYVEKAERNFDDSLRLHDMKVKTPGPIAEKVKEERPVLFKKLKGNQDALGVRDYSILEEKPQDETHEYDYEYVNHPSHYNLYDIEVIEMMRRIWGEENTKLWCEMTAFKYRMRMGTKPGEPIEKDLDKEKWYLKKSKDLDAE